MSKKDRSFLWETWDLATRVVVGAVVTVSIVVFLLFFAWVLANVDAGGSPTVAELNDSRQSLIQILGGVVVAFGLYLTLRRIRASERRAEALEDQIRVTEQGQVTERFTRAIEQLGSDNLQIRLGGIYSLERIAIDSEDDHWTVMEVLCAFVRERSGEERARVHPERFDVDDTQPSVSTDIQAAMTVIGRRYVKRDLFRTDESKNPERRQLDLAGIRIVCANLGGLDFSFAHFSGADFRNVNFDTANLSGAWLDFSDLSGGSFRQTNLQIAELRHIRAHGIRLNHADLQGATFEEADLREASMQFANLTNGLFYKANCRKADFRMANFNNAVLAKVDFQNANFLGAQNLTIERVSSCLSLHGARLDEHLEAAVREQCPELLEPPPEE